MIQMVFKKVDGRKCVLLGLDDVNVQRLTSDQPIKVDGKVLELDFDILIAHGKTQKDLITQLREVGFSIPDVGEPTPNNPVVVRNT